MHSVKVPAVLTSGSPEQREWVAVVVVVVVVLVVAVVLVVVAVAVGAAALMAVAAVLVATTLTSIVRGLESSWQRNPEYSTQFWNSPRYFGTY